MFNQNIFTVAGEGDRADVNLSVIQPIVNKSLGNGWSVGASEMNVVYDWEKDDWTSLPVGIKLAKMHKFGELPVQFNVQYEYNFADDDIGSPKQTLRVTAKFIFP